MKMSSTASLRGRFELPLFVIITRMIETWSKESGNHGEGPERIRVGSRGLETLEQQLHTTTFANSCNRKTIMMHDTADPKH